jgi:peptide deformylase
MAVRDVVKYPDPVLRQQAKSIPKVDSGLKALIDDMVATMRAERGYGLAANQVGVLQKILVYDDGTGLGVLINAKIVSVEGEQIGPEGCLSVPGLQGEVRRAEKVVVKGMDAVGKPVRIKAEGLLARIFQHEIDHLEGTLFIDRVEPDTLEYVTSEEPEE